MLCPNYLFVTPSLILLLFNLCSVSAVPVTPDPVTTYTGAGPSRRSAQRTSKLYMEDAKPSCHVGYIKVLPASGASTWLVGSSKLTKVKSGATKFVFDSYDKTTSIYKYDDLSKVWKLGTVMNGFTSPEFKDAVGTNLEESRMFSIAKADKSIRTLLSAPAVGPTVRHTWKAMDSTLGYGPERYYNSTANDKDVTLQFDAIPRAQDCQAFLAANVK